MTVTTLVSLKGAPGVTTLAFLVGATWPDDRRLVVVEADPFGGDLAARFQLSTAWGWSSYVTASRRSEGDVPIEPHLQGLPGGLDVLVLPAGDRRVVDGSSVDALLRSAESSEGSPWDLVVDGGRLTAGAGPGTAGPGVGVWLDRSDRILVVTRRDPPSVLKVREQADALRDRCGDRVGLVVVGRGPHDTAAIAEFTGIPVLGALPDDPAAARMVAGAPGSGRLLSRSLLVASARRLALLATGTSDEGAETPIGGGPPADGTVGTDRGLRGLRGRLGRLGHAGAQSAEDPVADPAGDRPAAETALPSQAAMR